MIKYVFFLGYATSCVTDNVQLIKMIVFFATGSNAVLGGRRSACRITFSSPLAIRGGGLANDWRWLCSGASRNFRVGPEVRAMRKQSIIPGNPRVGLCSGEEDRSRDSIFGLVNSTYVFKITNHNQHTFNIKYLSNLIKKYWTCFRYQKWQILWCASRPASACRSGGRCGKFAWGSNLTLVFKAVQSRSMTTFRESWHDYPKQ